MCGGAEVQSIGIYDSLRNLVFRPERNVAEERESGGMAK